VYASQEIRGIEGYLISIKAAPVVSANIDLGKIGDFNMEIRWPVFLKDRDGLMDILESKCFC